MYTNKIGKGTYKIKRAVCGAKIMGKFHTEYFPHCFVILLFCKIIT